MSLNEIEGVYFGLHTWNRPLHGVSGDFSFVRRHNLKARHSRALFWVVGDCAGHGADAAAMRALIVAVLDRLLSRISDQGPHDLVETALAFMDDEITAKLEKTAGGYGIRGADLALNYISPIEGGTYLLESAQAGFPIYVVRGFSKGTPSIEVFDGSRSRRKSIGINEKERFDKFSIKVADGDLLVAMSDGATHLLTRTKGCLTEEFLESAVVNANGRSAILARLLKEGLEKLGAERFYDDILVSVIDLADIFESEVSGISESE